MDLEDANLSNNFDHDLAMCYALHLKPIIRTVSRELCHGCQVDHPSQKQHDVCLIMDEEDRIHHCLERALEEVDVAKIINLYSRYKHFDEHTVLSTDIFDKASQTDLWKKAEWRNIIVQKILTLD